MVCPKLGWFTLNVLANYLLFAKLQNIMKVITYNYGKCILVPNLHVLTSLRHHTSCLYGPMPRALLQQSE